MSHVGKRKNRTPAVRSLRRKAAALLKELNALYGQLDGADWAHLHDQVKAMALDVDHLNFQLDELVAWLEGYPDA